jgi:aryl-alcohol dehydrogenase-like predicted oxidoreductase
MEALHEVVRADKARYIGASAMFAWQFQKALHVAEKDHLNLIYREEEREMLPALSRGEDRGDPVQSARIRKIN